MSTTSESAPSLRFNPAQVSVLRPLLAPSSIAVIGASRRPGSMGGQILENLVTFGFTGPVYPVNRTAASIHAIRAAPSVTEIGQPVELAVIVVPREQVLDVVHDCGRAGVKGLVVISAGYTETGPAGAAHEQELLAVVRRYDMRMIGPNCMGVVNSAPAISMNATFATTMAPFGRAAFVSQSGALGLNVLDHAREYGIGISQFVSVGNKPDVSGNDLLAEWEHDATIDMILMYVENFGNPRKFLDLASRITRIKPIIVVKSGRSASGARAATSHTGALAASDTAVDALLTQAGVLRASSMEELFDMTIAFGVRTLPRGRRTAVLTNAGGPGILAADAMEGAGLDLVELHATTIDALRPLFPPAASIRNPLDMIASATPTGYRAAMTALLADPAVDAVVPIFVPPFGVKQTDVAEAIIGAAATCPDKPVLAVLMGREGLPVGRAGLSDAGIPTYIFPESAARSLATLYRQAEWQRRTLPLDAPLAGIDVDRARSILSGASADRRQHLTPVEALNLLAAYGIAVATTRAVSTEDDAMRAAADIGYPVALKVSSGDISHKTDVGGVHIGITSDAELVASIHAMRAEIQARMPTARVDGFVIQQMVAGGRELIAGITRDPQFGALIMFGLGGIYVEVIRDVTFRLAPLHSVDAQEMVTGIRSARVLDAVRGMPAANRDAIANALRRLSQLAVDFPTIAELDANPLLADEHGIVAADARVTVVPPVQLDR